MRRTQVYYLPLATIGGVAGAWLVLGRKLPERAAFVREEPYVQLGWVDPAGFLGAVAAVLAVVWIAQAATDRPRKPSPLSHQCYYFAFGLVYATIVYLAGSAGRAEPETGVGFLAFAGIVPAAWLGTVVAARLEDARARREGAWGEGAAPALDLWPTEDAVWVGSAKMRGYALGHAVNAAALTTVIVLGPADGFHAYELPPLGWLTGMAAYGYLVMSAHVTVGGREVVVRGGPFRVRLWRIPVGDVVEARAERVRPRDYGGWGYHVKAGRAALVVRAGEGLVLRRRGRRDVVVTVDDAETGAGLINDLLARRARPARRVDV